MTRQSKRSTAATTILQLFYASGKSRLCPDLFDLRRLGVPEEDAVHALQDLRDEGLIEPDQQDDDIALTRKGRSVTGACWPRGQLADASGPRRIVGHFQGEWHLPVRIAVPIGNLLGPLPRSVTLDRELQGRGGGFSAWEIVFPPTGPTEDRLLVGLHATAGTDGGHSGGPEDDWIDVWLSVDRDGKVRERRRALEEIVFLIAMGAA